MKFHDGFSWWTQRQMRRLQAEGITAFDFFDHGDGRVELFDEYLRYGIWRAWSASRRGCEAGWQPLTRRLGLDELPDRILGGRQPEAWERPRLVFRLYVRQRGRCAYCLQHIPWMISSEESQQYNRFAWWRMTLDHVVPWERGGKTIESNLVLAHRSCNSAKCARLIKPRPFIQSQLTRDRHAAPVHTSSPSSLY
jgi:5-methylcytosine-specific restriction endonuclease McrA